MKVQELLDSIVKLSGVELTELVNGLQEKFGIDSSMLVSSGKATDSSASEGADTKSQELFKVVINNVPKDKKIELIKFVKTLLNIGLGEAKTIADAAESGTDTTIKSGISKTEADELFKNLNAVGATAVVLAV